MDTRKTPVHYIGFLNNVDDSILRLNWRQDLSINKALAAEIDPFLKEIRSAYGEQAGTRRVLNGGPDCESPSCYCIRKEGVTEYEFPDAATRFPEDESQQIMQQIERRIRSLRLFKNGNIVVRIAFLYCGEFSNPRMMSVSRKQHVPDRTKFTLEDWEIHDAQSFIEGIKIPFQMPFLQTAFEVFEYSYELVEQSMAFLSLMIAMEVLLNPSDHELRYRVSRNTGVLLGQDRSQGEATFKEMKDLYDKRSKLVHTGDKSLATRDDVLKLREYVRRTIREVAKSRMPKEQLTQVLNACGFGERPWRLEQ